MPDYPRGKGPGAGLAGLQAEEAGEDHLGKAAAAKYKDNTLWIEKVNTSRNAKSQSFEVFDIITI